MEIHNKEQFVEEFIKVYNQKGFGSMNKSDFEVLIFDLLKKYGNLRDLSNYEMSVLLQIPEAKIRKLDYESELKYSQTNDDQLNQELLDIISESRLRADLNKIEFVIESKFLRSTVSARLKKLGHYSDGSFNTEIIRIHFDSFVDLLESLYSREDIEQIVNEAENELPIYEDAITFKGLMKKYLESVASEAGKQTVKIGTSFFSGIPNLINIIIRTI